VSQRFLQLWCLTVALLAAASARAQVPPQPGHETEAETVAKCAADMRSPDATARRRAILVLGKYPTNPLALEVVVRALEDEDALVRRSALVSLTEQESLPQSILDRILGLLNDPDVHVRRIASSMLPQILLRARLSGPVRPADNRPDPVGKLLNEALKDEDATVVKNILGAAGYLPGTLDPNRILALLDNTDREVRLLALQNLQRIAIPAEAHLAQFLAPLVKDDDPTVRGEVASLLLRCGGDGIPALRALAKDPVADVRLNAAEQLILLQDETAAELLDGLLADPAIAPDAKARLVPRLLHLNPPHFDQLRQLATAGPSEVRAAAIRAFASRRAQEQMPPAAFFLAQLDDPSILVRQAAMAALRSAVPRLTEKQVRQFLDSDYPDVRSAGVQRARSLPPEQAQEILLDACLDDDLDVRCNALTQLALGRTPGWEEILIQSLGDPEEQVQRTALSALGMVQTPESAAALAEFLKTCKDPILAGKIRLILERQARRTQGTIQPPRIVPAPKQP
jgi:HEAT repeat protein